MNYRKYDLIVIGGGPAGLAAAASAIDKGVDSILVIERDDRLGGILNQCIHNGFGLHTFNEELTGPEYADRFIRRIEELGITCELNSMVMDISMTVLDGSEYKAVTAYSMEYGMQILYSKAVILAMGCRERARGALNIPGFRPAGVYSAGTAQKLVNIDGYMPGKEIVILGSGDIGLIMARRLTFEGASVKLVAELMPYSGGLKRNIVQCLDDYNIPLKLSHTVIEIHGKKRVEGVTIARVGDNRRPIPGSEEFISCDTLLLSVGLIPENEMTRKLGISMSGVTGGPVVNESLETSMDGVFACGNVLHVHDLVDYVSEEAALAGECAAEYLHTSSLKDSNNTGKVVEIAASRGVRYTVPMSINTSKIEDRIPLRFRSSGVYKNCFISLYLDDERIIHKKKQIISPGEMETLLITKDMLRNNNSFNTISVAIEEE